MATKIYTNNHQRQFLYFYELTEKEKKELDWIEDDTASVFRYRGNVYSLDEFVRIDKNNPFYPLGYHGYHSDSYFSGILIKVSDDGESYQVATYIS